ncbi:MAG: hypothetical protein NVS2B9_13520 [Myxococcales bacterium]
MEAGAAQPVRRAAWTLLAKRKELGGEKLSCSLWQLPAGSRSWPFHVHHVTEEALVVPDSGKVGSAVGARPNQKRFLFKADAQVDYFSGEPEA